MFGYFFDVANDSICLLILEFLEKAEDQIDEEEALDDEYFEVNDKLIIIHAKSSLECLTEGIFAGGKHHNQVESCFPLAVCFYDQHIQNRHLLMPLKVFSRL